MSLAASPDAPPAEFIPLARLQATTPERQRLSFALPAAVVPEGRAYLRIDLQYWRYLRVVTRGNRQDARMMWIAIRHDGDP